MSTLYRETHISHTQAHTGTWNGHSRGESCSSPETSLLFLSGFLEPVGHLAAVDQIIFQVISPGAPGEKQVGVGKALGSVC